MAEVLIIADNGLIQADQPLVWAFGDNPVTFDEPFSDLEYWFVAWAPDVTIRELRDQRTENGTVVNCSAATTEGSWEAKGQSDEFRTSGLTTIGTGGALINRGTKILVEGNNTILFPRPHSDIYYQFPNTRGKNGSDLNIVSKFTTHIIVNSPGADELDWISIGT